MKMTPYYKIKRPDMSESTRSVSYMDGLIGMVIVVAIGLAIYGQVGPAAVAPGITATQNTTAIAGYSTWDTQTQNTYKSSGSNLALAWWLVPFLFILGILKYF